MRSRSSPTMSRSSSTSDTIAGVWPGEVIEERAADIAEAADVLLRYQAAWRHRRVESIAVLTHEQVRRHVSIDFTVPEAQREGLRLSAEEFIVPLALLSKRPLVHFDLRNEEQHAISLLTAEQHRTIARELLYRQLDDELAGADELIETVLADEPQDVEPQIAALEAAHGVELADFRSIATVLSRSFIAWAIVRGLDRRRVFKFAFDEPVGRRSFVFFIGAAGCTEAESYHAEVAVPADLKARSTLLVDRASGRRLAVGERDADRPALFYRAQQPLPDRPQIVIEFAAERWRFLAPAALVATIIALLIAPPFLFSDLKALPETATAAVGLVLSTSAVFSVLILRTDEHALLRLMLLRARALLAASTIAALFAAASIGFRTAGWVIEGTWALAALASVLTAGILIVEAIRASP
jgi:hypothetical protein